jgi:hypothetical protein
MSLGQLDANVASLDIESGKEVSGTSRPGSRVMACQASRSLLSVSGPDYDGPIRAGEHLSSARSRPLLPRGERRFQEAPPGL